MAGVPPRGIGVKPRISGRFGPQTEGRLLAMGKDPRRSELASKSLACYGFA
jgi:hypothetical protein